jgi:hypothetical protein
MSSRRLFSSLLVLAALMLGASLPAAGAAGATKRSSSSTSPAPPTGPVPQGFVGMMVDGPLYPTPDPSVDLGKQLDAMVASGVQSLRLTFDWSSAQPYRSFSDVPASDRSQFVDVGGVPTRFGVMDQIVGLASQRRLTELPVVLNAPSWDGVHRSAGIVDVPRTDAPYANFLAALVHRYGPNGSFWQTHSPKVPIRMWQIWNEPNIPAYWPLQPYVSRYVGLLRAAHNAIKKVDPGAEVVLAGLPNFSWQELAKIYKVRGARNLFDVVAIHPYTKQPQGVITILSLNRQVMNANGDARKQMLADEISWPSSLGKTTHNVGFDFATTEAGQARNIGKLLPMLGRDRKQLGLAGFYYYTWAGRERKGNLAFDFAGLFRFNNGMFVAKPAFGVFRRDALALEQCRQKGPVATSCVKH